MTTTALFAPEEFWKLTPAALASIVNGCGPAGWKVKLIPNHLLGLSIKKACDIHDFMYYMGKTQADKDEADRVFKNNMLRIIEADSCRLLKPIRRRLAKGYYEAVHDFGGPAFWVGKNPIGSMQVPGVI